MKAPEWGLLYNEFHAFLTEETMKKLIPAVIVALFFVWMFYGSMAGSPKSC